ncbi:lamin tail domain-containing protein 1 isoform X2 [Equus caballus]|uniref:Lamin tail domain containing 1 n=1 Tax=Equus caballus TaxID=9796 RepID=A0A9L0REF9_HORSE|nr:lamin tail domain-containing protein 1 isoform X3 [Equus caballus]XP_023499030.1 lamin tail domain-containing protein 1 isoform X3 [Equus caballus]XP_023499031.1 lamin tail domain-containing protein 1 isoform X3 [Equus caballus]XP_023499032.1 lamin tail domain-containing protein 1 isoform X3 [Equus caballus]XP_023499033.1 lamin tail domain-containing protein 1 isoform X3 [Equus caballus]
MIKSCCNRHRKQTNRATRITKLGSEIPALKKKLLSEETNNSTFIRRAEVEPRRRQRKAGPRGARLEERKETPLPAKMKDLNTIQETSAALQSEGHEQEDKMDNQAQREDTHDNLPKTQRSSVHFFPKMMDSDTTTLSWSRSLSNETPLSCFLSTPQISGATVSTIGRKSKSIIVSHSRSENSLGINSFIIPKKHTPPVTAPEPGVTGEGEDYFLSLFGDSKKLNAHSLHAEKTWKHFSMILEEVGQSRSSALGDIKIAEVNVKGLFVKLINSSLDKELEIGDHILQQNVNGQIICLYRFLPNIIMQANSTVTVWAAASEAKHQPPADFLWKEQNKFKTSPNCTTILCKPNGEAVAWYTPIHWKQAWEKLETDIEFDRCSIVSPASRRHLFHWPEVPSTTEEKQDQSKKDISKCHMEPVQAFLKREKEIPPTLFPNRSPWCHSPDVPAHPYCSLIEPHITSMAGSSLDRQPRPQSARPNPAQGPRKTRHLGYKSNRQSTQSLKNNNIQA